jgi:cytochrome b561
MAIDALFAWTRAQRRLHWWTAALVLLALPLGWLMIRVPLSDLLAKFLLYQLHKTLGILVFLLASARVLLRITRRPPLPDPELPEWQHRVADIVQFLLYCLILLTPILGYLTAATAPAQIPTLFFLFIPVPHLLSPDAALFGIFRWVHWGAAVMLLTLATLHAAAAIYNYLRGRRTMARMWGRRNSRPSPAARPASVGR